METSRRALMLGSLQVAAAAALPTIASAQAANGALPVPQPVSWETYDVKPAIDLSFGGRVAEIIFVARDAEKTARRFSDVYGVQWDFYTLQPRVLRLHDKPASGVCSLKIALGVCGGRTMKIVQPVSGVSPYSEFLRDVGEGQFGISIGMRADYDDAVAALSKAGARVQMESDIEDGCRWAIFDTVEDLAMRIELTSSGTTASAPGLKRYGGYQPSGAPVIDMTQPVQAGGRYFGQLGCVVADRVKCAKRYAELLGIRTWRISAIQTTAMTLRGKQISDDDMPSTKVGVAISYIGDMQIELLDLVPTRPGGSHREFFDRNWPRNGFQHLMLSPGWHPTEQETVIKKLFDMGMVDVMEFKSIPGVLTGYYIEMPDIANLTIEFNRFRR